MNELILLVEDDQQIHEMVSNHLQKEGYKVRSAFDGDEALPIFSQQAIRRHFIDFQPQPGGN